MHHQGKQILISEVLMLQSIIGSLNLNQASDSTLYLQGEKKQNKTFRKVAGTSAFLFCFVVNVTEWSNQMNLGD